MPESSARPGTVAGCRLGALVLAAATLSGCATDPGAASARPVEHPLAVQRATGSATSAVALRSALEMMFGDHVRLTVELMRDRIAGASERTAAAAAAVDRNAGELERTMTDLYGATDAAAFAQLWAAHVRQLLDYAAGLADGDDAARDQARTRLGKTESDIGRLLSTAVGGALTPGQVADAIEMHVRTLLEQADAYAAGDHARAYTVGRECFAHMLSVADTLAGPIAASQGLPTAELTAPRRTLQAALGRLLAEHTALMIQAMRAASDGAPEFGAAGASLNANSADLAAAVAALYGQPAAARFLELWAGHVEGLVHYAQAKDDAGRGEASKDLSSYARGLSSFLADAVGGRVPATQLTEAMVHHDDLLVQQEDAYRSADQEAAQRASSESYGHMFQLSQVLADAIGDAVASRLPRGGAQTGGGGLAREH